MMRVLHVIPSVGPHRGGPSIALELMASALAEQGVHVDVVTTDDNDLERLRVPLGTPTPRAGATFRYFPRQLRTYGVSWPLRAWVRAHTRDYDVLHTHALFSFAPVMAARAAWAARVPYVVRPLGTLAPYGLQQHASLKRLSLALFERALLQHAAAIHCTSEAEASEIRLLGDGWPTVVVPLGIEVDATSRRDRSWLRARAPQFSDRLILLFLSRIDRKKNLELVLDAVAQARRNGLDVALVVAGTGEAEYLQQLQHHARRLGVQADVLWAGHLDEAEKRGALAAADAFVLPSRGENFGIAVVEALAAGLPVIVSKQVGIADAIVAHDAGIVIDGSVDQLLSALIRLQSADQRAALSERAYTLAQARYSKRAMGTALVKLYQDILSR